MQGRMGQSCSRSEAPRGLDALSLQQALTNNRLGIAATGYSEPKENRPLACEECGGDVVARELGNERACVDCGETP